MGIPRFSFCVLAASTRHYAVPMSMPVSELLVNNLTHTHLAGFHLGGGGTEFTVTLMSFSLPSTFKHSTASPD